jgi:deazaflavin-dependent oxidoreductase (nitroreductase family)
MAAAPAKTPWLITHVMNPLFLLTGAFPVLTVKGRRSGKSYRTPINVVELNGSRYLVSPRGETGWSRNLRAGGEAWLRLRGHQARYRATEVPPAERGPIIRRLPAEMGQPDAGAVRAAARSGRPPHLPPRRSPLGLAAAAGVGRQEGQHVAWLQLRR